MKKLICMVLCALMVLSMAACHIEINTNPTTEPTTQPTTPQGDVVTLAGSGTQEDPWQVGKNNPDDVRVYYAADAEWLVAEGEGEMMDFNPGDVLPWTEFASKVNTFFWDSWITSVGANAFAGLGTATADGCDIYFGTDLVSIGNGAFAGCKLDNNRLPEALETIGSRAFADCSMWRIELDGRPEIAADAFAGSTGEGHVHSAAGWTADAMPGDLNWVLDYTFSFEAACDDMLMTGSVYIPAGETYEFDAVTELNGEGYHFHHYEEPTGGLTIENPENPVLTITGTADVSVKAVMEAD